MKVINSKLKIQKNHKQVKKKVLKIFSVWVILTFILTQSPLGNTSLRILVNSDVQGMSQIFFAETTNDFTESRSSQRPLSLGLNSLDFSFSIKNKNIGSYQRWDPAKSSGNFTIRDISLHGLFLRTSIPLTQLSAGNQIKLLTLSSEDVEVLTESNANDPQLLLSAPLTSFVIINFSTLAGLSSILLLLMLGFQRLLRKYLPKNSDKYLSIRLKLKKQTLFLKIFILIPVLIPIYLLTLIFSAPQMQFGDYFGMLESLFSDSGTFNPLGLFQHANEHLVFLPKIIYVINIYFFSGSNVSLGVFVWFISILTAAVLFINLKPFFHSFDPRKKIIFAWSFAIFLFPLAAAHNYLFAMSGTAWILANFLVVCAIIGASNREYIFAGLLGVLATFSYGTGLAVWPALLSVVLFQRFINRRIILMFLMGAVSVVIERITSSTVADHPPIEKNLFNLFRSIFLTSGGLFTRNVNTAIFIGLISIIFSFYLIQKLFLERKNTPEVSIVGGLICYGVTVFTLFALSRTGFSDDMFLSSRYMAVVSLFFLGLTLLSLILFQLSIRFSVVVIALLVMALTNSSITITRVQDSARYNQELGAVAAVLGVANNGVVFGYRERTSDILRLFHHYPFNGSGDKLGCGLLKTKVSLQVITEVAGVRGFIDSISTTPNPSAVQVSGWIDSEDEIECILLLNSNNVVVGAGIQGWEREDARKAIGGSRSNIGFIGIAKTTQMDLKVAVRLKNKEAFIVFAP